MAAAAAAAAAATKAASATLRAPVALRSLAGRSAACLSSSTLLRHQQRQQQQQRRWAQVHDVRLQDVRHLATSQVQRNVAEKYREKLDRKARAEGLPDVDALKTAYADRIAEVRREDEVSIPGLDALLADEKPPAQQQQQQQQQQQKQEQQQQQQQQQSDPNAPSSAASPEAPPTSSPSASASTTAAKGTGTGAVVKPLSEILDLDKARALPAAELTAVWRLRHAASASSLCAAVPAAAYAEMAATAARCPTFVLPVPRGAGVGAEVHLLQWVFDAASQTATVLFTQLAEYKARGEFAQPHTSVTHYWDADLARAPGLVLMNGALVEGRGVQLADAQWLVMLLQRFYGPEAVQGDAERRRLVHQFARGDPTFSLEKLLEESEKLA